MKRLVSALIIFISFLTSCSDEISLTPGISFLTAEPEISEETAIFRIISQEFSSADTLRIPFILGGTAERGVDYDISADYFTLSKDSLMDSVVVYTKQLGTKKTVSLDLQIPEGFVAGKYLTSQMNLQDKYGFLTFEAAKSFIADTTDVAIVLCDSTGSAKILKKDAPIAFSVNAEKSTAKEGVDFTFLTSDTTDPSQTTESSGAVGITAGSNYTTLRIVPLKTSFADGQDKIVLNVHADDKFETGPFSEVELTIIRPELRILNGDWAMTTISTDATYFENFWGEECTGYDLVPELFPANILNISFNGAIFSPSFAYGLERFFIANSSMEFGQEIEITDLENNPKTVQLISLDHTNRYFTDTEASEDTTSYIGVYIQTDSESNTAAMELYILDHTSRSFMPELEAGNKYGTEKPVATEPGMYLCTTFVKM